MVTRETSLREGLAELHLPADGVPRLLRYCDMLEEKAIPRGFLGPREGPRLIERHILESAALAPLLPEYERAIDVGSGAGLPGVVIACVSKVEVLLLEAERRRAALLEEVVGELDLTATVLIARAEDAGRKPGLRDEFGAAVARALAPPAVTLELLLPFVRPGGRAVIAVGPSVARGNARGDAGREDPAWVCAELGGRLADLRRLQVPGLEEERWAMIVSKSGRTPERYPRRVGVPAKRPLRRPIDGPKGRRHPHMGGDSRDGDR